MQKKRVHESAAAQAQVGRQPGQSTPASAVTNDPTPSATAPILIKKYGNRRLYSTAESRYLTLEDVERLVHSGREVQVVDARSGEEITSQILMQILLEGGRAQQFPVAFLQQIIRLGDEALQTFLRRFLANGMDMFLTAQKEMERRYQSLFGNGMWPFNGFDSSVPNPPEPPLSSAAVDAAEVQSLRSRLEELERRLNATATVSPKPARRAKPGKNTP